MVRRLSALLVIACTSGLGAAVVANARNERTLIPAARIPAIPVEAASGPRCPIPQIFRPAFEQASRETHLPLALLTAVARVESEFQPYARSAAGARGLLQVMPTTAAELELDADHPVENVLAGSRYLRRLFDQFKSSDLALAAYNAGPTAVARSGGAPSGETLTYVADVTSIWRSLAGCS
ncbi:MAG TPA: lytic transglycosylase domain-containing protein [Gaiellaceae bacterium]|nr:lytic transglycosylase domain-containing protein [Gaiellaceae bacterium]